MKEAFQRIPTPLQRVILLRLADCTLGIFILILGIIAGGNWFLIVPGLLDILYMAASAGSIFLEYHDDAILDIEGTCFSLERTGIRKRTQTVYLRTEQHDLKIICRPIRTREIAVGDQVTVYLKKNTPVYESDGQQVICDYILLKKSRTPENKLAH